MTIKNSLCLVAASAVLLGGNCARADTVYVSIENENYIEKFTANEVGTIFAGEFGLPTNGVAGPWGIAFDNAGDLFEANYDNNTIEKFNPNGIGSVFATNGLNSPASITFDSAGNLFVANAGDHTIEKFTPDGTASVFATTTSFAGGLACDSAGNVYASIVSPSRILKFTMNGVSSVFSSSGLLGSPAGLAFDLAGNLYVANYAKNTIVKLATNGVGSVLASTGLNNPGGLAFDSVGNLYAANGGTSGPGSIEMFTSSGVASVYASNLDNPFFLAIQPGLLIFTPKLEIQAVGTNAVVSWPVALGTFSLETTPSLTNPNWNPVLSAPVNNNGSFVSTNSMAGSSQFFRLKKN
ncbi:MAG TPA: NHL repeat-containing protein [Candidatus Limnocylindrales bacterium]|nr:NHL repeat-containing protein [Candidatus Limnocylindrales bacterium]